MCRRNAVKLIDTCDIGVELTHVLHHGETITRGHYTATVGANDKWMHCDDLVIRTTKLAQHISNSYMLFYLQT